MTSKRNRNSLFLLIAALIALLGLHIVFVAADIWHAQTVLARWSFFFDLDNEYNLPTIYTTLLLVGSSFICTKLAVSARRKRDKLGWGIAALGLFYLALDEAVVIHEKLALPIRELLSIANDSVFYHAWVIPALAALGLLGLILVVLSRKKLLPPLKTSALLYLFLFGVGAIVFELIGTKLYGSQTIYRLGIVTMEEMFEIGFASLLFWHLLQVLHDRNIGAK